MGTRHFLPLVAAACAAAVLAVPAAAGPPASAGKAKPWRVTIENLTPAGSQPLSPPLFAVHTKKADVWSVGAVASHGVAAIAEDANNAVLTAALAGAPGVAAVWTGAGGPIMPGTSATYVVETRGPFDRLSLLTMLVNTNDAFTGLDALHVKGKGGSFLTAGYDAGSERNNELAGFIPGPCCGNPFVRDPEGALVRMHDGILGVGDLSPGVHGWTGPAARITIARAG